MRARVGVVEQGDEIGVVTQVAQLVGDVAVVDVDRDDPRLVARDHHLEVRDGVAEIEADVVAHSDARRSQRVRQTGRALVELGVGAALVAADRGFPRRDRVGDALQQVCDVELHVAPAARRSIPASVGAGIVCRYSPILA